MYRYIRFKVVRWLLAVLVIISGILLIKPLTHSQAITASYGILLLTALVLAWTAVETQELVEITRQKERPFLELYFTNESGGPFRNKVLLKNFGQTPAYSPQIEPIKIDDDLFEFDPLGTSQLPIQPGETREVWVHHRQVGGGVSVGNVVLLLEQKMIEHSSIVDVFTWRIKVSYFDTAGIPCIRKLFIRVGGILTKRYLYTSTSAE